MYSNAKRKLVMAGDESHSMRYKGLAVSIMNDEFDGYNGSAISPRKRMVTVYCRKFLDRVIRCLRVNIMDFTRKEFAHYCHCAVFDGFTEEIEIPVGCIEYTNIYWTNSSVDWVVGLPLRGNWAGFQRGVCFVLIQGDLIHNKFAVVPEQRDYTLLYYQKHIDGNVVCRKFKTDSIERYGDFVDKVRRKIDHCVREFKVGGPNHTLSIVVHCWKINGDSLVRLPDESWRSMRRNALYYFARSAEDSQKVQILCKQYIPRDEELLCIYFDIRSCSGPVELCDKVRSLVYQGYEGSREGLDIDLKWVSRDDSKLYRLPVGHRHWRRFMESVAYVFGMPAMVKPPPGGRKRKRIVLSD